MFECGDSVSVFAQQGFNHRCRLVSTPKPDDFGWRSVQRRHFCKIGIKSYKDEAVHTCKSPDGAIVDFGHPEAAYLAEPGNKSSKRSQSLKLKF